MNESNEWKRRGFIGTVLVAGGAAMGWMVRRFQTPDVSARDRAFEWGETFSYDVSEFEHTDPALLLYEPAGEFETGMDKAGRIAWSSSHGILVAGGRRLRVFDVRGNLIREAVLDDEVHALHAAEDGRIHLGQRDRILILDDVLKERSRSPRLGARAFITSLAPHGDQMFVADAGSREVVICDLESGRELDRFGRKDPTVDNPGFNVPSPYFDLAVASDGRLRIANPGRLRLETYTLDGRFVDAWGEPGMQIDRFCGCCNPVFFTLLPNGDVITSEKGLARINVYSSRGVFRGAVAGPETLVDDKELAKQACRDCSVGAGFDVAVANRAEILALDPFRKTVRRFAPRPEQRVAMR